MVLFWLLAIREVERHGEHVVVEYDERRERVQRKLVI